MTADSFYLASAPMRVPNKALSGQRECRTCVVGGGFAGLNTALGLIERGQPDVVLLEAKEIGFGASGRNGGFVFGGFSLGPESLAQSVGAAQAKRMYAQTLEGVELIRRRVHERGIDCDLVEQGVLWANWFRDPAVLQDMQRRMAQEFDVELRAVGEVSLRSQLKTDRYHGALFEPRAMHFHPLKYARGLADAISAGGGSVFEASPATSIERNGKGWLVRTPQGVIKAERVVLACGGYLAGLRPQVDAAVLPIATYVMVTEPLGARAKEAIDTQAAVYDTRFAFDYYRLLPDTRLLWGGRISVLDRSPAQVQRLLYRDLLKVYPQLEGLRIEHAWSGLMSYARHEMPQIGEVEPGLWVAQAFGGHGVATTTLAGEIVASAIADGDTRWQDYLAFGLSRTHKPFGFLGAQLTYWWLQSKDAWKDWRER